MICAIAVIQVYTSASVATEKESGKFYDTIQKEVDSKESQDFLIISGNFYAKVGKYKITEEDGIIGNVGLRERNERGSLLVDFAFRISEC